MISTAIGFQPSISASRAYSGSGATLLVGLDVYNVTNSGAVVTYNQTYGASWLTPQAILQARFAKITAQFDFYVARAMS